ncbi:1240_t:CDS:2, partial [Scutellospora calospora]
MTRKNFMRRWYNETPLSYIRHDLSDKFNDELHIQHNFSDKFDDETIHSDSEVTEEEVVDDELLESLSDVDNKLESLSDCDKSINILTESEKTLILSVDNNTSQLLTSCCIIDTFNSTIRCCNATKDFKKLWQLVGMWELAKNAVQELHEEGLKKKTQTIDSLIHFKRCLFCGINKYFYSHGKLCSQYSWNPLDLRARYICYTCFEKNRGHLHYRPGNCKSIKACHEIDLHNEDIILVLKLFSKLILDIAEFGNLDIKNNLLYYLNPTLQILIDDNSSSQSLLSILMTLLNSKLSNTLSLFVIKMAIKLKYIKINKDKVAKDLLPEDCIKFGNALANKIWISKLYLKENCMDLENPMTLKQYYDALPRYLTVFFSILVHNLVLKCHAIAARKAKQEKQQ